MSPRGYQVIKCHWQKQSIQDPGGLLKHHLPQAPFRQDCQYSAKAKLWCSCSLDRGRPCVSVQGRECFLQGWPWPPVTKEGQALARMGEDSVKEAAGSGRVGHRRGWRGRLCGDHRAPEPRCAPSVRREGCTRLSVLVAWHCGGQLTSGQGAEPWEGRFSQEGFSPRDTLPSLTSPGGAGSQALRGQGSGCMLAHTTRLWAVRRQTFQRTMA